MGHHHHPSARVGLLDALSFCLRTTKPVEFPDVPPPPADKKEGGAAAGEGEQATAAAAAEGAADAKSAARDAMEVDDKDKDKDKSKEAAPEAEGKPKWLPPYQKVRVRVTAASDLTDGRGQGAWQRYKTLTPRHRM